MPGEFPAPSFMPRPDGLRAVPLVTTNLASAELIKYAANSFLLLKISFIKEVAELAEKVGADILQIADGIGLDARIGTRFLNARIGWGGSCFGKDTSALISTGREYGCKYCDCGRRQGRQLSSAWTRHRQGPLGT